MRKILAALLLSGTLFAHSVSLTWTAPPTGATSYRVYRAVGSCGGQFSLMGQTPGTQLWFINGSNPDGTPLIEGTTYCYVVTTVLNGAESMPSQAFVGTLPIAPTNLQGVVS